MEIPTFRRQTGAEQLLKEVRKQAERQREKQESTKTWKPKKGVSRKEEMTNSREMGQSRKLKSEKRS